MGLFSNLPYSPKDGAKIIWKHYHDLEASNADSIPFRHGDRERFVLFLEQLVDLYEDQSRQVNNLSWYGHGMPDFLRETIIRIQHGQNIQWYRALPLIAEKIDSGEISR